MTDKWIIYYGDQFYPCSKEFKSEAMARIMWKKECNYRKDDDDMFWHGSYLAKVIEELQPKKEA